MGKFIAPEWQLGYRYISLEQKNAAVKAERPIPVLMTHDLAAPPGGKVSFFVVSRIAMLISTGEDRQWFHECGSKRHKYHPWAIENKAKTPSGRLDVSMTTMPLVGRSAFLVKARFVNVSSLPLPVSLSFIVGGVGLEEDPRMVPEFSESTNDVLSESEGVISIFDQEMREPKIHVAACCNRSWDVRTIDYRDVFDKNPHDVTCPLALANVPMGIVMPGQETDVALVFTYGNDPEQVRSSAIELTDQAEAEEKRTVAHFKDLLNKNRIKTPSRVLDNAYKVAVCDMEYTWWDGLGWMEIPSYWNGFFPQHNQVRTAASMGQLDRAKDCLLFCGLRADETGLIQWPTVGASTWGKQDWSHLYIWSLDYYYRSSGDIEAIRALWPHLIRAYDRAYAATATEPGSLIRCYPQSFFDTQEDDINTPYKGSSPTIAGIITSRQMAGFAEALGLDNEAEQYRQRADKAQQELREELWDDKLGRFLYWINEDGIKHTDSQQHTYSWPVLFGITDALDSYTSLRHLKETLISPRDIVYNSNQFPEDRLSCLGAQESIVVTGLVAVALARLGDAETGFRIMQGASECIMGKPHEGLVPEQAQIDFQSYFSGSAAAFAWGVVEGLFGIRWNIPAGELILEPCLPSSWPHAEIKLKNLSWRIEQDQNKWKGILKTDESVGRRLRVKLPPCNITSCRIGSKSAEYSIEPAIDGIFVTVTVPAERKTEVSIEHQPIPVDFKYDVDVAAGDQLTVHCTGASVVDVVDRSHVTQTNSISDDRVEIRLADDSAGLKPTIFLSCRCGEIEFIHPLPLSIHEKLEVAPADDALKSQDGYDVEVDLTSWTDESDGGRHGLKVLDQQVEDTFEMAKGITQKLRLPLSQNLLEKLSPGKNSATLELPDGTTRNLPFHLLAPFVDSEALRARLTERLEQIDLSDRYSHRFEEFFATRAELVNRVVAPDRVGPQFLSEILPEQKEIEDPGTGLSFRIGGRRVAMAAQDLTVSVPVNKSVEKIYALTVSCFGSEDTYAQVGKIGVTYDDGAGEEVALRIPGNINWGFYHRGWETSLKWNQGLTIILPGTVLDILEIPCDPHKTVKDLYLATCGRRPAIGLLGITVARPASSS